MSRDQKVHDVMCRQPAVDEDPRYLGTSVLFSSVCLKIYTFVIKVFKDSYYCPPVLKVQCWRSTLSTANPL